MKQIVISGTGLFTPPETITNEELVESFNEYVRRFNERNAEAIERGEVRALGPSYVEFIEKASGIKSRYVMEKKGVLDPDRMYPILPKRSNDELSLQAEIAVTAIRQALKNANKSPEDVDAVIMSCANAQRAYPAVAIEIQNALGIKGWAYDMNVACSAATFGLQAAINAVQSGQARCVVAVNPEITSAHLEWRDRDCHFIFGDVCTAAVVEAADTCTSDNAYDVLGVKLQTQFSNNIRNNFGFMNRCEDREEDERDLLFMQEGRKVFKEVCPMAAEQISAHMAETGVTPENVTRLWLHQANINMNDLVARKVMGRDVSLEEAPIILDRYANTASAGSIIAFHLHNQDLEAGDTGVICSFGAGYSIGSLIVRKR
ncbi:MAG: beta-ketoacyl-ACP synthase [Moraxellaceae bacterium]|jgi:beta-ketodecanoyl-[acyl-carrier-protein] synthase|nr:beta-ketoacyl-ACP synthase [Moraxellaceae bacterium]